MTIPWQIWISLGFIAVVALVMLAAGIVRFRSGRGKPWKALTFGLLAMVLCVSGTVATYYLHSSYSGSLDVLKKPPGPSHLQPDWGAQMSKEDRTKHSQMLARITFQDWGITVNYFDENGTLRPYQPTPEDRARLQWRRNAVAYQEQTITFLEWAMLSWLLIPWLGLIFGFVPWGALTKRSNMDAPQSAARH